ncbi:MAG TPA: S8 family serine peptidase [Blastocatellia bacterium]|nr:S8 family serine peptidase [Blastocatellia bacterium]
MFSPFRLPVVRLLVSLALAFSLTCGSVLPTAHGRADSRVPTAAKRRSQPITQKHRPGELIVKFREDVPQWQRELIVQTFGRSEKPVRGRSRMSRLTVKDGRDLSYTIADLKQLGSLIEYAEPNYIVTRTGELHQSSAIPNDPKFAEQWALSNTGQHNGGLGSDIGILSGWQQTTGSRETIIAVIDTGIDPGHPDLIHNLWVNKSEATGQPRSDDDHDGYVDDVGGWNFVDDSPEIRDDHGHGTAMAGIIAAEANNGQGISGVMWQASLMPLKALDAAGSGAISDVVEAIDYAAAHGASVINCSFGTDGYSQALLDSINQAAASGALVVASAGNGGRDLSQMPYYPASYQAGNLITVAASTNDDQLASFSNYGAGSVQLAAPGVEILTTAPGGGYLSVTGTSASAPLVAGVAGLLKTMRGWVSAQTVKQSLIDGARRSNYLYGQVSSGGIVSAGAAITALMSGGDHGGGDGSGGSGGGGGGDNGGSGGGGGEDGGGGNNTQANGINLNYIRNNRPHQAEPRVSVNLPPETWQPPVVTENYDTYNTVASRSENETGNARNTMAREDDPTLRGAGTAPIRSIDLGSQNINFGLPIVSLGGRGPGVNLTLSYNSQAVWVKNPYFSQLGFNPDNGLLGPGWSLGLGKLLGDVPASGETSIPPFWHSDLSKYAYLWVEPDGTRRILAGTNATADHVYKSIDSSHIEYNNSTGILWLSDGTQIKFTTPTGSGGAAVGKELLAREIKDRNGNLITIANTALSNGRWVIDYITDTLGRTIDFYYENNVLTQIRQDRGGTWHVFVRIDYAPVTISTNFTGVNLNPANINGQTVWMPWFIEFPNRMNYRVFYTSYCQAYQIEKWVPAIDGQGPERPVAETWYDLPSINGQSMPGGPPRGPANVNTAQTDCPEFATREEWAENWSRDETGWVTVGSYQWARYSYYFFTDSGGAHTRITDPIGRIYRTDVSTDGLTHIDRVWANNAAYGTDDSTGTALRTATTTYESAADGLRPTQIVITDGSYTRKTGIHYWTQGWVALPDDIFEYENGGSTIYRHRRIFYSTSSSYTDRRIFGTIDQEFICQGDGEANKVSGISYAYDESSYFDTSSFTAGQHDSANYGTGFIVGRRNTTTVSQYDALAGTWRPISRTKYNKTGMVAAVTDAAGSTSQVFYEDNFSPAPPGTTYGLPTRIKDPDGYWSGVKYNWYTGQPVETYHLVGTSGTGAHENVVTYSYDDFDRPTAINQPAGHDGQTTYTYWDNWLATGVYTRIDAAKINYSFAAFDGAGRMRWQGADHPDGSSGKFSMVRNTYDAVGRMIAGSNATAVNGSYVPIDDDATPGWLSTTTVYDALDRPVTATRPDGNMIQYDYTGCGCAGSSTVTVTDERGRKRRTIHDFLGRLKEAHNLTSAGSTYSKAVYTYDARDLMAKIEHYNSGTAHQDRTFTYDGYARMTSQTTPEAGTVTYGYKANDWLDYFENDRIVSGSTKYRASFNYNGKGQITEVKYNDNDATPDAYYEYGQYGERTWMREKNDAGTTLGSTQYAYDSYKRLQSETRVFNGLSGTFRVSYVYNQADALKQVTYKLNTWEKNVYYDYSYGGALIKVGSDLTSGTVTENIAKDFNYRGFMGLKNVTYGNERKLTIGYDQNRLQMTSLQLKKTDGTDPIMNLSYDYSTGGGGSAGNNGRLRKITDNLDGAFTAEFGYDDHNRLTSYASTYGRNYSYDAWGNLTGVSSAAGGGEAPNYTLSYATNSGGAPLNNRINNAGYSYDAAGNMTGDGGQTYTYDAASRLKTVTGGTSSQEYDGDGNRVRHANSQGTIYYLRSSVLGQPVVEIDPNNGPYAYRAYVYSPGGQLIALQSYEGGFYWSHGDHLGSGRKLTNISGTVVYRGEFDPHGQALYEWSSAGSTLLNSHKFTGYERDWAANLDHAKARMYHHNRGRFMQPDPLGLGAADLTNPQSLNLYAYVGNDPVNSVDPNGMDFIGIQTCVTLRLGGEVIGTDCEMTYYFIGGGGGSASRIQRPEPEGGSIGGGGGSGGRVIGGENSNDENNESETNINPICDALEKKIDEFVNRDKRQQGGSGTHGLVHRFREQINGANGPGTESWTNHDTAMKDQQKGLRDLLNEWDKNGCGPPPSNSWKWATRPTPSPSEWIGNRREPATSTAMQTGLKVAAGVGAGYLFYRGVRLLPSLFPPFWPTLPVNLAIP